MFSDPLSFSNAIWNVGVVFKKGEHCVFILFSGLDTMLQNQTLGLLSIVVLIAACQKDCITVSSIKDYSLIGHTYKTTSGRSLMTCIITCDQDTNCYSFNYKFPDKICELNNVTQSLHPLEFVSSPGAIYFDQPSRPSGSCLGDRPCKNKGKCENVARAPGFKCECQYNYTGEKCEGNIINNWK